MGVHRERLAASKSQRRFVEGVKSAFQKWALQKLGREVPPGAISPRAIDGVQLLPIPVPPMFEEALGYRGALRFVEFGYSRATCQFVYSDGGDSIPSDQDLWIRFLRHPLIAPHLPESQYPTLYGVFPEGELVPLKELWEQPKGFEPADRLLLDRQERKLYLCRTNHTSLLFALTEPEGEDHHSVFIDGILMNPATENYKLRPDPELAVQRFDCLDVQLKSLADRARHNLICSRRDDC
ncbi:MAG TPA: hypothetical protein VJN92_20695 [Candidatus Acidoferrum sp.]|nr:hypothetical protein [Candidatus Acidoferrum sp.]